MRAGLDKLRGNGKQIVVSLEFEKPGSFPYDQVAGIQSVTGAPGGVVPCVEKWCQREAAENAGVLLGPADAGGKILVAHGVGDGDEMTGAAGGTEFGGAKEPVGGAALERTEGRAVNGVNNGWHPGPRGGESSENTGLAAVRVDQVGSLRPKQFREFAQRDEIIPRMNGTDEFRENGQGVGSGVKFRFKRAFRAGGGAGDKIDFKTRFRPQTQDGGDGVLLRATNDQPRNDMRDAHGPQLQGLAGGGAGGGFTPFLPAMTATNEQLREANAQIRGFMKPARVLHAQITQRKQFTVTRDANPDSPHTALGEFHNAEVAAHTAAKGERTRKLRQIQKQAALGAGAIPNHVRNPDRVLEGTDRVQSSLARIAQKKEQAS